MSAAVITCAELTGFAGTRERCGLPATQRVTIRGASSAFDCEARPTCDGCARIDERIVAKYFPLATMSTTPLDGGDAEVPDASR